MAVTENMGVMTYIDEQGNKCLLYPVTKADCVDGLEEKVAEICGETIVTNGDIDISTTIGATFPPAQKPAAPEYEGYDIDILNATADDVHAYIDEVVSGKPTVTKEILGKDASGQYDIARYIYANREHIAWQKKNYPKMYAWKNGTAKMYTRSVSPRVGEGAFSTPYIGTTTTSGSLTPAFTNLKDQCGYRYGYRKSSSGEWKAYGGCTSVILPVPSATTSFVVRFKGLEPNTIQTAVYFGTAIDDVAVTMRQPSEYDTVNIWPSPDSDGVYTWTCTKVSGEVYMFFNVFATQESDFSDFIVTIDEPIEYTEGEGEEVADEGTPITAVSATNRSRTIGGVEYVRSETDDVEPTLIYTDVDDERNGNTSIIQDGVTYIRYPLGDLGAKRTKLTPIFIYANEHGIIKDTTSASNYETKMCALVAARFLRDLASGEQANNPLYQYIRANCMLVVIPVANPFGYNYNLTEDLTLGTIDAGGYFNYKYCNINRNYDTPGWDYMLANGESQTVMGAYPGSENETQYIMNTMVESGAVVAMSLHGLGSWEGYCAHQGQNPDGSDYNQESLAKVVAFLQDNYGYTLRYYDMTSGAPNPCANMPNVTSKSPSYITQCGAYGGIVEFSPDDVTVSGWAQEMKGKVIENAYAQTLNLLGMWIADAVGVEEDAEGDGRITELESRVTTLENGVTMDALIARIIELENRVATLEGESVVTYTVTRTLTHCTVNNNAFSVNEGESYSATITANSGYVLDSVKVTMGGTDISSTAYNNGVINIGSVTGNVVITAAAIVEAVTTYTVTNNLTNCTNSNSATSVEEGSAYNATITANEGYTLGEAVVPAKAAVLVGKRYSLSGGAFKDNAGTSAIVLPLPKNITGDITVTLVNMSKSTTYGNTYGGTVPSTFTGEILTTNNTDYTEIVLKHTPSSGFVSVADFSFVTFFVNSTGTDGQYDNSQIFINGEEIEFEITTDPTIATQESTATGSVTATMGGSAVTVTDGVINIASVTGDIVITATAV